MRRSIVNTSASVVITVGVFAGTTFCSSAAQPIYIGYTTDNLNLRTGAGVNYKIILEIPKGKDVEVMSSPNSSGWVKVRYGNKEGWCNGSYIKEKKLTIKYISGVRRLALREKASTESKSFGYVYEGEKVSVIDYTGDFARIKYNSKVYYILKKRLVDTNPAKNMYVAGVWRKGLYETASTKATQLGLVYEGEKVTVVGKSGNYYHTIYNGKRGYLHDSNIVSSNPATYSYVAGKDLIEVKNGSDEVSGYLAEGQKIKIFGKKDNKLRISFNGKTGFVDDVNYIRQYQVKVIDGIKSISIYKSKSTKGEVVAKLTEGTKVDIYAIDGDWAKIKYNGVYAYIQEKYLKDIKVIKKDTSITSTKSSKGTVVSKVKVGDKVIVESYTDEWAKVKVGSKVGYIKNKYLTTVSGSSSNGNSQNSTVNKGEIVNDTYLRAEANWSSEKLELLKKGISVEIISKDANWTKVKYNGKTGYISNDYVKSVTINNDSSNGNSQNSTVNKGEIVNDTYLRAEANWSSEKLELLKKGVSVEIISKDTNWTKVKYNGKTGYISNDYVKSVTINSDSLNDNSTELGYLNTVCIEDPNVNKRYIIKNDVKVLKEASSASDTYGCLKNGDQVEYISSSGDYDKVRVNDKVVGYVKKSEISHRNVSIKNTSTTITKKLNKTHDEYVDTQVGKPYVSISDVRYYSNPLNYNLSNKEEKYQFLKLDNYNRINAYELNEYLNSLPVKSGQTAIFKNQAEAFIKAAKKYNIDPIYLVAHTMLETGYGSSKLAQGIIVDRDAAGNKITPTKVHNLYGIGAVDSNANDSGAKTAYALGWTSIERAIEGAAEWISLGTIARPEIGLKKSDGYIHSSVFVDQYNLYSMRWDYVKGWHQYASDPGWALKISKVMSGLEYMYEGANLVFENIQYAPNIETNIFGSNNIKEMIVTSNLVIRSGPSENFRNIGSKVKGDVVKVIGEAGSYWVIETESEKGYILKDKLSNIDGDKIAINSEAEVEEGVNVEQLDEESINPENELINSDTTEDINEMKIDDVNDHLEDMVQDNNYL